jgi:Na+-transporting methylmalonyl-CoA/oxaloacetate decarboxylase gamma subunit
MSGTDQLVLPHKRPSPLLYFLGAVFLLFIGILIFVYQVTSKTHPVYVDERGNPTNAQTSQPGAGGGRHP